MKQCLLIETWILLTMAGVILRFMTGPDVPELVMIHNTGLLPMVAGWIQIGLTAVYLLRKENE